MTRVARIGKFDVRCTPADARPYWLTNRSTGEIVKDEHGKPLEFVELEAAQAWCHEHQTAVRP